ncbi:MAG: hypothetical protein RSE41_04965, partial [Clostridia bacterium]
PADKFPHKNMYLILIASIGFVFSLAWLLAAKGSKFWQENWECHLDLLEDKITGPLYKIVLQDTATNKFSITSPQAFSVSKINQWVAALVIFIWASLMFSPLAIYLAPKINSAELAHIELALEILVITSTFIFSYSMIKNTKTQLMNNNKNNKEKIKHIKASMRKTELE